jgi:hypothetical protein
MRKDSNPLPDTIVFLKNQTNVLTLPLQDKWFPLRSGGWYHTARFLTSFKQPLQILVHGTKEIKNIFVLPFLYTRLR